MKKIINLNGQNIEYELRSSQRARNVRLEIRNDGQVLAIKPRNLDIKEIEDFILKKANWIIPKVDYFKKYKKGVSKLKNKRLHYLQHKYKALVFVRERLEYYNQFYNFKYQNISIRNQKTRWGSCSIKGNLNFNYRIVFLPKSLANYIIVHELCHLREMNHSRRFWKLVEETMPNHKYLRKKLRLNHDLMN